MSLIGSVVVVWARLAVIGGLQFRHQGSQFAADHGWAVNSGLRQQCPLPRTCTGCGVDTFHAAGSPLSPWPARAPLFVGRDGERITRGILQSRVKRAFKHAGPDAQPVPGALVHGLRHTYATELAGSDVSVYTLMKLLGHESMTASQRYVSAAGTETRSAAARNPIYKMITPGG